MNQPDLPMDLPAPAPKPTRAPRKIKCACCDEEVDREDSEIGDPGTDYDKKPLCRHCYEGDYPEASIRVFWPEDDGQPQHGFNLFDIYGGRNETSGDQDGPESIGIWRSVYTRTDGWRGYYSVKPPRGWAALHEDVALSGSEDERQLKAYDDALRRVLGRMKIVLVRAICRTSNVFSAGVDYFVRSRDRKVVVEAAEHLREVFRDPERQLLTSITGKDPKDFTASDRILGVISAVILEQKKEATYGETNDA